MTFVLNYAEPDDIYIGRRIVLINRNDNDYVLCQVDCIEPNGYLVYVIYLPKAAFQMPPRMIFVRINNDGSARECWSKNEPATRINHYSVFGLEHPIPDHLADNRAIDFVINAVANKP